MERPPERGDIVEVSWLDVWEDVTGDPNKAKLARRVSFGVYWEEREIDGVAVLVTTTTLDEEASQQGFCCYPRACVRKVRVVRRARKAARRATVVT